MNKIFFILLILAATVSYAQPQCGFDLMHSRMLLLDAEYAQRVQEFNTRQVQFSQSNAQITTTPANTVYEIPVVVHVIHTGGAVGTIYNPTDSAIRSMIDYVNATYAATYAGYADTTTGGVCFPVKFVLAKRNESCGYTTGINRVDGSGVSGYTSGGVYYSTTGASETAVKALSRWRNTEYYNIWIVNKIDGADGTSGSFTAGYAYFPGASYTIDGTVILATQIGAGKSTSVHELGHAFNLYHTFEGDGGGGTCPVNTSCSADGDMVCDTDPHKRSSGCPSGTNTCTSTSFGTLTKNFMDYSSCRDRFTPGQYTRWMSALLVSRPGLASSIAGRDTSTNVVSTSCTTKIYTVNAATTTNMGPTKVELNDLTSNSRGYAIDGYLAYIDRSCTQRANLIAGSTYTLSVTTETNPQKVNVFIDYNNNGSFSSGELVYSTTGVISGTEVHDTTFTVPTSGITTCTPLRMRVVTDWRFAAALPSAGCDSLAYGQAEDFSVYIKPSSAAVTLTNALTSGTNPSCTGSSLTFTATPGSSLTSPVYYWYVNGILASTGSTTYTTSSISHGSSVRCKVLYTGACGADSIFSNTVVISRTTSLVPDVTIAVSPSSTICSGTSVTFTATPVNGGTSPSYQWKLNGANVGTSSTTYVNSSLAHGDIVRCVMTSSSSCATPAADTSNSITMTVTTTATPDVTIAASPGSSICSGTSVTFTATPTSGGTPTYQWKLNGGNVGTNSATYANSSLSTGDIITCVMTSSLSCVTKSSDTSNAITMTVTSNVTPDVTIAASPGSSICSGTSVTFTATPTNGGTPTYQWKLNGSNVGTNSTTYVNSALTNGAVITCVMASSLTCVTKSSDTSNAITMTVTSNVTPDVTIAASPGSSICSGTSVTFTASPTNGGTPTYQWKLNGTNVGTNSTTYVNGSLANGDVVTCVMASSLTCVTKSSDTSNAVTMTVTSNLTPDVTIAASPGSSICSGTSVTFTASPTNGGTPTYQWKLNGGNVGTNSTTYVNSSLSNGDVITCVMASSLTCVTKSSDTSNAVTMTVTTTVTPDVTIAASPGSTICSGTSVTFTATPTNGGTPSYQWKLNGSNVGTNSTTYVNSALANGAVITCVMTSSLSCVTKSSDTSNAITMTVTTTVTPSVSIAASPGNTICSGTSVTFTATPTNGGTSPSYQWKVNSTNVGTNSSTYASSTLSNGDVVTCVMTSGVSCASPATATSTGITMAVTATVTPSVTIAASPGNNICAGVPVTFTATPTNGGGSPSYQWKVNSTNAGTNSATFLSSSLVNGDVVTCELTSNATCASPATATSAGITMTVNPLVTPGVTISESPDDTICSGTNVTFTAAPANGGTSPSYQWKLNGNNVGTNATTYNNNTLLNGDIVNCEITSNANCLTTATALSSNILIGVQATIVPTLSITSNKGTTITAGDTVTFSSTTNVPSPVYQWKKNTIDISGANASTYMTSDLLNTDKISLSVSTNDSCTKPGTILSNALDMTVGVQTVNAVFSSVTLAPNPNSGNFRIYGTLQNRINQGEAIVEITNAVGVVIYKETVQVDNHKFIKEFNIEDKLTDGIYLLRVTIAGESQLIKFVTYR